MNSLKHLPIEDRVKVGSIINKMKSLAEGQKVEKLSYEETSKLLKDLVQELSKISSVYYYIKA